MCEPVAESARSIDCPFGDRRRDAKPLAQLPIDYESEHPDEQPSERSGRTVIDGHVGREPRIDSAVLQLEVEDRQRASPDGAQKRVRVLALGKENSSPWFAPKNASNAARALTVVAPVAVIIEYANLIALDFSEPCCCRRQLGCVDERRVDIEWGTDGGRDDRAAERGLEPNALDRG